jgi:hypothetical protein
LAREKHFFPKIEISIGRKTFQEKKSFPLNEQQLWRMKSFKGKMVTSGQALENAKKCWQKRGSVKTFFTE